MDNNKLKELCGIVRQKMDVSDLEGALKVVREIQGLKSNYITSEPAGCFLIDIGATLNKNELVKEGIGLLEEDFETLIKDKKAAPTEYYNLANGYYALSIIKLKNNVDNICFKDTELNVAKKYYRKALEYEIEDDFLLSQIYVNLGNCFDQLGRGIDALDCYEKALKLKPEYGMAIGNKGLALYYYSYLVGKNQTTFLVEAYQLISAALKSDIPPEAVPGFTHYIQDIEKMFEDKESLNKPVKRSKIEVNASSDFERFLIDFCINKKLYLNVCDYCQKCEKAIGDPLFIRKMITPITKGPIEEDPFLRLAAYLNQIKQDYVAARFLLVLSQYNDLNIDFVDKDVKIIDTLNYEMHNIYMQLVKLSFKNFYDILDKIAFFINDYLVLKIPDKSVNFGKIWYLNGKNKTINNKILNTRSNRLNALFDLHKEFEDGDCVELKRIRNALTHRFISIRRSTNKGDIESLTEEQFLNRTLELAELTRNAIIYLLSFVDEEEHKKEKNSKKKLLLLTAFEVPDHLK